MNTTNETTGAGAVAAATVLTKHQERVFGPVACPMAGYGPKALIEVTVRYDDRCGNGHNTFSVTGEIYVPGRLDCEACGMLHDEIARYFPELAPFLKWHLCSSDGPLHYVENTLYWAGQRGWCDGKHGSPPNLEHARNAAIWPEATDDELINAARRSGAAAIK